MRHVPIVLLATLLAVSWGCGTTDETRQETPPTEPPPPPAQPAVKPADPPVSFNTRTDTVVASPHVVQSDPVLQERQAATQYLIQVGAFKDAQNATRVQNMTRERLKMTVLNDYNTLIGMYQIRVGFFETKEAASAVRNKLVRDYPQEYKDSWIVELTR
jgi:cell division protein FtsN